MTHTTDHRLIALNHSSCVLFKNLGLWPQLAEHAARIQKIHVSHRGHFGTACLTANEAGIDALGYVVPAKEINTALYTTLATLQNIHLFRPAKLTQLIQNPSHTTLTIESASIQQTIETTVVVGADGTHSSVRSLLNIPTETIDYQQKAIVTITELQRDHQHIAYERFCSTGVIAMLPLPGKQAATIWSDHENTITELLQLSDTDFLHQLQKQFGYRLGRLQGVKQRFVYPLTRVIAKKHIKQNVILLGNAAHTIHPIAATGFNLALYEVAIVAEHLGKQSAGSVSLTGLPDFLTQQKININLSHYLTRLFSLDFSIAHTAQQIGLLGFDMCSTAKRSFIKRMAGKIGYMPALQELESC
ncbi:MAG: hypothetical protein ACD_45C00703G0001 [uncultured bacterium]|nr:MAG: hypothetical protein ACD_45C00703G0001 [uncultured bacterium]